MPVDRCICKDVSFKRLKAYALEHTCDYQELHERFKCGQGCGLCIPYIRQMLKTGITSLPIEPTPKR